MHSTAPVMRCACGVAYISFRCSPALFHARTAKKRKGQLAVARRVDRFCSASRMDSHLFLNVYETRLESVNAHSDLVGFIWIPGSALRVQ